MKSFYFPLDRVLSWRQAQARLAEAALARLHAEAQTLNLRIATLDRSVASARTQLLGLRSAAPIEIGALEHFRNSAAAQVQHLRRDTLALQAKIAQQTQAVVEPRREAQLLEHLRERRLESWHREAAREVEQQAEESYLARFTRSLHPQSRMHSGRPMR
jgi:flagellar export protein FliJ